MIKIVKQLPNLMTLCNLLLGCVAIVQIFSGRTHIASLLIFAAAVLDFLDGFVARMLNAHSELGKQLDSLADAVTFGVTPGMILYQLLAWAFARQENGINTNTIFFYPAFLVSVFAVLRLGIFNTSENKPDRFQGVPTPAIALFIACLPMILIFEHHLKINDYLLNSTYLFVLIFVLCYLMLSKQNFIKLSPKYMSGKVYLMRWILIGISVLSIFFLHWTSALIIFPAYLVCSILEFNFLNKS
jgi:CDP-diacylglycerol---serine O-phosphatidyltransferase